MSIEYNLFTRYNPIEEKLINYGFVKKRTGLTFEKLFNGGSFRAVVTVSKQGNLDGTVFDVENNDEFLPLRIENNQGAFVGEIKEEYEKILLDIRENCFSKNYFTLPQSNRITNYIINKYGNEPEFLWEKLDGCGVFRNQETEKWYGIIMDVDRSRIIPKEKGIVDVMNVKLPPDMVLEVVKTPNVYQAYHMNKKHWISMILDDSLNDGKIMEFIDISYTLSDTKKKRTK